jgi:hypothetical protein
MAGCECADAADKSARKVRIWSGVVFGVSGRGYDELVF